MSHYYPHCGLVHFQLYTIVSYSFDSSPYCFVLWKVPYFIPAISSQSPHHLSIFLSWNPPFFWWNPPENRPRKFSWRALAGHWWRLAVAIASTSYGHESGEKNDGAEISSLCSLMLIYVDFMLIYVGFMLIYDDSMMIYDDLCWFMLIYVDLWWIYDDLCWSAGIHLHIPTSTQDTESSC